MKLRSIICASAAAAAIAAGATVVESSTTFARVAVDSNFAASLISIPLNGCGNADENPAIYVTNLVMTTNLAEGDTLLWKHSGNWYAWDIDNEGKWRSISTSGKTGQTLSTLANETAIPCGEACWLYRATPSNKIYLYGQVNKQKRSVQVAAGGANGPSYTIVGCPVETNFYLAGWAPSGIQNGDSILLPADNEKGTIEYRYNSGWKKSYQQVETVINPRTGASSEVTNTTWTAIGASEVVIPGGCGFMYGRAKGKTAYELTWGE